MAERYDTIGLGYTKQRRPDPRIAATITRALGAARTVVNIGAGAGSYEPQDRVLAAVEPSLAMIAQRPPASAPAVCARAEQLPFARDSFDAAMAVLTVHHWADKIAGLAEMRRVARGRVVIVTCDPAQRPWLTDYLPALAELDAAQMPAMEVYSDALGPSRIAPIPVPHDCVDGFLYAYWRRPEAYLDPHLRAGSSSFHLLDGLEPGLARLERDLLSGEWEARYGHLRRLESYDAGYRLVVADRDDQAR